MALTMKFRHWAIFLCFLAFGLRAEDNLVTVVTRGDEAACRRLLASGGTEALNSVAGVSPLYAAALSGHAGCIRLLLKAGSSLETQVVRAGPYERLRLDGGRTALHGACSAGHEACALLLLQAGARADSRDDAGRSPMMLAAMAGSVPLVRQLLDHHGAELGGKDDSGVNALQLAVLSGRHEVLLELQGRGMDLTVKTADGRGLMHLAAASGQWSLVQHLIGRGLDLSDRDDAGRLPLHHAAASGRAVILRHLVERDQGVNSVDKAGWTPLHHAVAAGTDHQVWVELLRLGANEQALTAQGESLYSLACRSGREEHWRQWDLLRQAQPQSDEARRKIIYGGVSK